MNLLKVQMFLFGWYYKWRTKCDTINKTKLRTKEEIIIKKKEFETKLLLCEKQSVGEVSKYNYYIEVLKWVLKES